MAKSPPSLEKPTLDKDLDKVTFTEEASHYVLKPWAGLGLGLIFLLTSGMFAALYVLDQPGFLIIVFAAVVAGYMAMNIGANDVTNNVGAAVGARAISMPVALTIAAVFEIIGALFAGGTVVQTIESSIVSAAYMPTGMAFVWVMMAALLSSAIWINIATWSGAPISTTHSIIGGILGAGIAAAGLSAVHWLSLFGITLSWMLSPVLGGGVAALLLAFIKTFIIYREDKIEAAIFWTPILVAAMTGIFTSYFVLIALDRVMEIQTARGLGTGLVVGIFTLIVMRPVIRRQAVGLDNRNQSLRKLFGIPLILSAALLSFAHGANDVSNAVGPLSGIVTQLKTAAVGPYSAIPFWVMLIGALGISCGLLLFGPRLIRVVGHEITRLNPMRAFCVALSTAITVILASTFGLPVSTTHIAVGAVFGIGFFREWYTRNSKRRLEYVRQKTGHDNFELRAQQNPDEQHRRRLVRRSHILTIVGAWVITVPISALLSAAVYGLFYLLFM
ncbi:MULTISPECIES: inorganic phosphate transporter [unclassified Rhizobium]|uniref:inorganic phosphate transporter n=1 Tax=unclassified Rhizobium TaxID=2613769 RepID=UPI0006F76DCF|nr:MULTISPECIES: inorganic phosphate transporter [unclassified Rhizobium]KQV43785.1 inorganic phosphate transporter [Rhizobium sp. Root1212]KRD37969.1 inorganic phosphate transporter [Rhizobium sp. Root268]